MSSRPSLDPYGGRNPLVDRMIGDVYPTVRFVAEHIPYLVFLAQNLTDLRPKEVEFQKNDDTGVVQWRYVEEGDQWKTLVGYDEITGPSIEFQQSDEYLQYRPVGQTVWQDLIPIADISGKTAEMQSTGNAIQWRLEGDADWAVLLDLSTTVSNSSTALTTAQAANASAAATAAQLLAVQTRQSDLEAGQHGSALYFATKAEMDAVTGSANQGAFVTNGEGAGQYRWVNSAWEYLGELWAGALRYMGQVGAGSVNSITAPGLYLVTAQLANMPAGAPATGLLEVNSYGNGNFLLHRFRGTDNARLNQYWERTSRLLTVPPQFPETWTYGPDAVGDGAVSRPKLTETYGFNGIATAVSANTLYREGCYVVGANVTDLPAGFGTGLLIATNFGDFVHQQLFTATSSQLVTKYERIIRPYAGSPSFPAWLDVSTNIVRTRLAAAYNQVGTISTGSFNDLTQEGNYTIGAALADGPSGWPGSGICRVSNYPGNFIKQVAEGVSYANVGLRWERLLRAGVSASVWKETPIATATIVGYGDSMTFGEGGGGTTYLTALSAALSNRQTVNRGIGGQRSNQIAQRQGGNVPDVTVAGNRIVAGANTITHFNGTPVTPTGTNPAVDQLLSTLDQTTRTIKATLAGVVGTVTRTASGGNPPTSETYTFTPDAGQIVPVTCPARTPLIVNVQGDDGCIQILWAGRNNSGFPTAQIQADVEAMVSRIQQFPRRRFLVLAVCNGNIASEYAGEVNYANIIETNRNLQKRFPANFVDVRRWLIDKGLAAAGITPTAQDLIDIGRDIVPSSLRSDGVHLNAAGYAALGAKCLAAEITARGW